jgi:hypothetical protein
VLGSPELGRYSDGVLNCAAPEKCDAVHRNIFPRGASQADSRANEEENPVNKETPKLSTDSLLETSKKGDIQLTEQELGKVSGGTVKFKFTTTTKDKVDTYLAN